jgi:hypothetical protein
MGATFTVIQFETLLIGGHQVDRIGQTDIFWKQDPMFFSEGGMLL